ncbi:MAG: ATP-binding protein, partial [Ignavibacteria bacterium]|nr:ATP-binding protein [Ignavibacteria bacterium]
LIADNERIGVIYVDSKYLRYINKNEIIKMFEILAGHAAVAIRNAKLYKSLNDAFTEVQHLHERLIQTERITLKKEINTQIGQEVRKLVHLALLENDSIARKIHRFNINVPLNREQVDELIQKLTVSTESIRKIQRFSQTLIDSTQCVLNKDIHDMNKVIRGVCRYLKHMNKFKDANIKLNLDKVPLAEFDAEQIEHVLVNILNNAVENRSDVTIKISTYFDVTNQEIVVQISDNGKGINPNLTSELFLTKINNDSDARGIGLKMCKKIIENHQGKISVLSDVGNGTTFFFTIPILCKQ